MREEWIHTTLGDVTALVRRGRAPAYANDGLLVLNQKCIRSGNKIDYSVARRTDVGERPVPEWAIVRDGDVLVNSTGTGTAGRAALVARPPEPMTVDSHITLVRSLPDRVIPEFIGARLSAIAAELEGLASGSTNQIELSRQTLADLPLHLPPLSNQQRIVDLLGSVDSYIDCLQTQVEATRAARSALLAELLSNAGDDWRFARLGDVSTLQIGRTPPRGEAKYWSTDLERPFCTIADMYGRHCRPVREGVTELAEQEGKAKRMSAGTLLMSFKLTIGRVAFADCDLFPNEAIVSILPDRRVVTAEFLYYFLGSQDLTRESGQAVKGKTLNGASLRSIEVVLPSLEEQQEIVNLMDAVERQIESVDSQRDAALKLRSGVLSELLSGERLLDESYDVAVSL